MQPFGFYLTRRTHDIPDGIRKMNDEKFGESNTTIALTLSRCLGVIALTYAVHIPTVIRRLVRLADKINENVQHKSFAQVFMKHPMDSIVLIDAMELPVRTKSGEPILHADIQTKLPEPPETMWVMNRVLWAIIYSAWLGAYGRNIYTNSFINIKLSYRQQFVFRETIHSAIHLLIGAASAHPNLNVGLARTCGLCGLVMGKDVADDICPFHQTKNKDDVIKLVKTSAVDTINPPEWN